MSERRRRYRKPKDDKQRPMGLSAQFKELEVQPKILLKTKWDSKTNSSEAASSSYGNSETPISIQVPQKTIIFQKAAQSPASSPNTTKDTTGTNNNDVSVPNNIIEPVYQMTRPATVISSTGQINGGAKKLLNKTNTDFLVIGVVGTQGVGKSTILNLLANEQIDYDYFNKVFIEEDSIFPTKLKANKCSARSRTESTHMFITTDRMILLDTSPVLANAYKKDMTNNELDDLGSIIGLLSVCHLLLVVQDDYFNLSFLNLLRFAEIMKPSQCAFMNHQYFPNVLFVKNKAKRLDFTPASKACLEQMYKSFFKDSQLRIYKGQISENHLMQQQLLQMQSRKRNRHAEIEYTVNSFLMPEVKSAQATTYHDSLDNIVQQFRSLVFMTPRNPMFGETHELTEEMWFDWLTKVSQCNHNYFFKTYEDIQRKHLDVGGASEKANSAGGSNSSKEIVENWRE